MIRGGVRGTAPRMRARSVDAVAEVDGAAVRSRAPGGSASASTRAAAPRCPRPTSDGARQVTNQVGAAGPLSTSVEVRELRVAGLASAGSRGRGTASQARRRGSTSAWPAGRDDGVSRGRRPPRSPCPRSPASGRVCHGSATVQATAPTTADATTTRTAPTPTSGRRSTPSSTDESGRPAGPGSGSSSCRRAATDTDLEAGRRDQRPDRGAAADAGASRPEATTTMTTAPPLTSQDSDSAASRARGAVVGRVTASDGVLPRRGTGTSRRRPRASEVPWATVQPRDGEQRRRAPATNADRAGSTAAVPLSPSPHQREHAGDGGEDGDVGDVLLDQQRAHRRRRPQRPPRAAARRRSGRAGPRRRGRDPADHERGREQLAVDRWPRERARRTGRRGGQRGPPRRAAAAEPAGERARPEHDQHRRRGSR